MTTVHIAGVPVTLDGRYLRQRCAWCGASLIDLDLSLVAVPTGQEGSPATWPVNELVSIDGNLRWLLAYEDGQPLPGDCCARRDPVAA